MVSYYNPEPPAEIVIRNYGGSLYALAKNNKTRPRLFKWQTCNSTRRYCKTFLVTELYFLDLRMAFEVDYNYNKYHFFL